MTNLAEHARHYRDIGLVAIPLMRKDDPKDDSGNKRPIIPGWERLQMPDDKTIVQWFPTGAKRNIGIVCGRASGNLIVVDFDDMDAWRKWAIGIQPPQTYTVMSAKGIHLYYRTIEPVCGNKKLIGGDIRAQGGQVVAPPSVHLTGKTYEIASNVPIATVQCWEYLNLPLKVKEHGPTDDIIEGKARMVALSNAQRDSAVAGVLRRLSGERNQGNRNNLLYWCAHKLKENEVAPIEIHQTLGPIARAIGLDEIEISKTINSALVGKKA